MDERIVKGFLKIRSELLGIVLILCAGSMVVKTVFLDLPGKSCVTEYLILVGSPIYLAVRSHMLGVTQAPVFSRQEGKHVWVLVLAATAALMVYSTVQNRGGEKAGFRELALFGTVFLVSFCLVRALYKRHEMKRQEKLDSRYEEE